jgi:hypothetical protein
VPYHVVALLCAEMSMRAIWWDRSQSARAG